MTSRALPAAAAELPAKVKKEVAKRIVGQEAMVDRLLIGDVAGVVPVVPVRDTLKRVAGGFVAKTVDRADLVAVQTPQGFDLGALRAAHAVAGGDATDDASMVESAGGTIAIVDGDPANLKVTYPEDLAVAEALRSGHHG